MRITDTFPMLKFAYDVDSLCRLTDTRDSPSRLRVQRFEYNLKSFSIWPFLSRVKSPLRAEHWHDHHHHHHLHLSIYRREFPTKWTLSPSFSHIVSYLMAARYLSVLYCLHFWIKREATTSKESNISPKANLPLGGAMSVYQTDFSYLKYCYKSMINR